MTEQTRGRRDLLADAAIETLARAGMRGLTHRAVDQAAGLAEGSCSYYFRTRQALLQAAVERLEEVDAAEATALAQSQGDLYAVADLAARLVEHWTTTGRDRMLARYELALEANRRPELHTVFIRSGARTRMMAEALLAAAGAPDPPRQAPVFVACLDGLIFDHIAGAGRLELTRDELRAALLALLRMGGSATQEGQA